MGRPRTRPTPEIIQSAPAPRPAPESQLHVEDADTSENQFLLEVESPQGGSMFATSSTDGRGSSQVGASSPQQQEKPKKVKLKRKVVVFIERCSQQEFLI